MFKREITSIGHYRKIENSPVAGAKQPDHKFCRTRSGIFRLVRPYPTRHKTGSIRSLNSP